MRRFLILIIAAGSLSMGLIDGCGSTPPLGVSDSSVAGTGNLAGSGGSSSDGNDGGPGVGGQGGTTSGASGALAGAGAPGEAGTAGSDGGPAGSHGGATGSDAGAAGSSGGGGSGGAGSAGGGGAGGSTSCFCTLLLAPVCGTDGKTYGNECEAKCAGVGVASPCACAGTAPNIAPSPCNWNEQIYPPAKRRMLLRDEGDPHVHLIDLGNPSNNWSAVAGGPWARGMQLIGNNQILGGRNDGYEVFDFTTGNVIKRVTTFPNTQSAYRMANGETMLTQSGTVLTFLDKNDVSAHQISYPGFGFVRVARPTRNGTFLVPSDTKVFEGDATGKVLWTATGVEWSQVHEALMLGPPVAGGPWHDGDTLLCTAFGSSCDVIDKVTHMVTFRYGTKNMPNAATIRPNFFAEFEILPNGNIITSNWQGHGGGNGAIGVQVIEFNPTGDVVWFYKQDPTIFSSIAGVMVLDGKDPHYLHVQETSADSTWQPVVAP